MHYLNHEYHDRGMLKWQTAFAVSELSKSISDGRKNSLHEVMPKIQMSDAEIDLIMREAIMFDYVIAIQLNITDTGKYREDIVGKYQGADEYGFYVDKQMIHAEDIRNVEILNNLKWSDVHENEPNRNDWQN